MENQEKKFDKFHHVYLHNYHVMHDKKPHYSNNPDIIYTRQSYLWSMVQYWINHNDYPKLP